MIEVRFSGERLTESFRVDGKPLTLEDITLWRRGPVVNFAPLASVENAPLNLLNCRLLRSGHQGQNIVTRGRLRPLPDAETRRYRALLAWEQRNPKRAIEQWI